MDISVLNLEGCVVDGSTAIPHIFIIRNWTTVPDLLSTRPTLIKLNIRRGPSAITATHYIATEAEFTGRKFSSCSFQNWEGGSKPLLRPCGTIWDKIASYGISGLALYLCRMIDRQWLGCWVAGAIHQSEERGPLRDTLDVGLQLLVIDGNC